MAVCTDGFEAENMSHMLARTTITFNCKPQRWLKVGDVSIHNPTLLKNPTKFTACPIITQTVTISNNGSSLIINSETQDAYDALGNNCNSKIQIPNGFPQLPSGDNTIVASGGITAWEVVPKWWTV